MLKLRIYLKNLIKRICIWVFLRVTRVGWQRRNENKRRAQQRKQVFSRYSEAHDKALSQESLHQARVALARRKQGRRSGGVGGPATDADVFADRDAVLVTDFPVEEK
jgi:hypothetical protein